MEIIPMHLDYLTDNLEDIKKDLLLRLQSNLETVKDTKKL